MPCLLHLAQLHWHLSMPNLEPAEAKIGGSVKSLKKSSYSVALALVLVFKKKKLCKYLYKYLCEILPVFSVLVLI